MPPRTFKALVLATFVLGVLLRLPSFGRPLLSDDEAIYAVTADAMARGDLLYRDVVDHKPPLIYHVYQAGFAALGPYNTHGAHLLVLLAVLLTAAFLFAIVRGTARARRDGGTALAAAGLFLIFSTTWHDYDALAANCELFLLAPQTVAAWLLLRDICARPARRRARAGDPPRGRRADRDVGAVQVSRASRSWARRSACWSGGRSWGGRPGRGPRARGALPAGGRAAAARALPRLVRRAPATPRPRSTGSAFNFSYVGAGLTGLAAVARGLRRTAAHRRRGARPLRARPLPPRWPPRAAWCACCGAGARGARRVATREVAARRRWCWACSGWRPPPSPSRPADASSATTST